MILLQSMLFTFFTNIEFESSKEIILNQGFSFESLIRGLVGMFTLILIAYFFSNDRKAINWKTTAIGLTAQLVLAISVLKIEFAQRIFEFFGKIFIKTLDFTMEGSRFLLGDMVNIDSYGYVFLFQVLPTIIFFSALTSVLFYLVIAKILYPQKESINKELDVSQEKIGSNLLDAISNGTTEGLKLAASEFIGYMQLSELKDVTNLIHLNYEKSIIMATYMLCGFANFASIGIQIGGIGSLAPNQRENLSKFGFLAVVGGTLASLLSATIAGMIIG
jgi:nucleoside permease NupC